MIMKLRLPAIYVTIVMPFLCVVTAVKGQNLPAPFPLAAGWQLQDVAKVPETGTILSQTTYQPAGWYAAAVPGTVLTTLVQNKVYPEPLYGENNRTIPESLNKTSYWYRTRFIVPQQYKGKKIWLHFDGINYTAQVWVNGKQMGQVRGAFARGLFEVSAVVTPGQPAVVAVLVSPQPNPGVPHEHTIANGMGKNGGITASDGPTFLCSMGWDWIPAIRDRNTGIWQQVFLSATGPVQVKDPLVITDISLPGLDTATVTIQTTLENSTDQPQQGLLKGSFGQVRFQQPVVLAAHSAQQFRFNPEQFPQLLMNKPKLWWPNGFGAQHLYQLQLSFEKDGVVSDRRQLSFGIRKITYTVSDEENLTLSVNGVRVLCKGGNWGMDEAMKRIPRERLEAQIRMHQQANYTMIRNWVGQSTSEDFYELCDKYGIMLWDEFFQPNPSDGPNPTDLELYIANVREKILRYRNHASIALWCARNEGYPPASIDSALRKLMTELEPVRLYQPSSTAGRGVNSGGPYYWRTPREYYSYKEAFKTEIGSVSIPTLESIQGMMPQKDWETINDDWAEHDLAAGAQRGNTYPQTINKRYGKVANLADFVRKSQLANYEAFRAMYEGRNAKLFHPVTGVITWMSNPAQPSFVWQLYHHDLEPNASLFATRKACEPVHIQLNEKEGSIQVINNRPVALTGAKAALTIYNIDGAIPYRQQFAVTAAPSLATNLGAIAWPDHLSAVHFIQLELRDAGGKLLSDNFYWRALPAHADSLQGLGQLATVTLDMKVSRENKAGKCLLHVTLHNPGKQVALMTHLQLRRQQSEQRVLPVYYSDNYLSLVPGATKTITIEAALADLKGEDALVAVDGWNIAVKPFTAAGAAIRLNKNAQVASWPVTNF
jgi:beta-mannosidase